MKRYQFLILITLILISTSLSAQKKTITGNVKSITNEPLVGVTVVELGTTNGVITNLDGDYSVEVKENATLEFRFIGYKVVDVPVEDKEIVNIVLQENREEITEVVVVGYGIQQKVSVTGSISSIQSKDVTVSTSPTLGAALAGKISGLTAVQGNGQPGADDVTMYLRGMSTFNGASPLILVDGVPRDELRVIDPNEIESVSVLKDASATAVFGVRGANGVILITTKRGKEGKTSLNVNAVQSFSSFTRRPARIHSLEYIDLRNQAYRNDGYSEDELPYQPDVIAKFENPLQGLDPASEDYEEQVAIRKYLYCDHDYYGDYLNNFAPQTKINLNINGGTDKLKYFVNGTYMHQGSNFIHEDPDDLGYDPSYRNNRFGFRSNFDAQISKSFKAFLNVGSYIEIMGMPACPEYITDWKTMVKHTIWVMSGFPALTPGPTTMAGFGVPAGETVNPATLGVSPLELLGRMGFREMTNSSLNSTLGFDWNLDFITKGLSQKVQASFDFFEETTTQGEQYLPMYDVQMDYDNNTLSYANRRSNTIYLTLSKDAETSYKMNFQYSINYNRTFNDKHYIGGMVLAQRDNWEGTTGDLPYNVLGLASRFSYDYDHRYMLELDMGYNGSEQFAKGKRFGFFPAFSGAWVVSNEKFLQNNNFITNLKLRTSFGKVGNDQLGSSRFLYLSNITVTDDGLLSSLSEGKTIDEGLLGNEDLTWETSIKQNYGIDLQILKTITLTVDYFREHRSKILLERGMIPILQGVPLENVPKANIGIVNNQGVEVEVSYNKMVNDNFSFMIKSNFAYAKNKVINYDEAPLSDEYAYRYKVTGFSIDQQWGIPIDYSNGNGYFNSQDELDSYLENYATYEIGQPRVGDFKYIDVNEDGKINDKDQTPIGYSPVPRITYGLTCSANYKGFDALLFFQGVGQCSNYYSGVYVFETSFLGTYFNYHRKAWTAERYANNEEITYPSLSTGATSNHIANSFFVMNKSYCRLRNVEIGYTIKNLKKLGISEMRVSLNGQNILLFTNFKMKHIDPELTHQMDYPISKTISAGVSINF